MLSHYQNIKFAFLEPKSNFVTSSKDIFSSDQSKILTILTAVGWEGRTCFRDLATWGFYMLALAGWVLVRLFEARLCNTQKEYSLSLSFRQTVPNTYVSGQPFVKWKQWDFSRCTLSSIFKQLCYLCRFDMFTVGVRICLMSLRQNLLQPIEKKERKKDGVRVNFHMNPTYEHISHSPYMDPTTTSKKIHIWQFRW